MSRGKGSKVMKNILYYIVSFVLVFLAVSIIVTGSFLVFFHSVDLPEGAVEGYAPYVFINSVALTAILMILDTIRKKFTVDRSVKEMQEVLQRLMDGDFSARILERKFSNRQGNFGEIAASINRLAEELSGIETLRTDFVTNVSHELKTPLAVMQNYGTMLQKPGISEEMRLEYAKAITEVSRRLASLITNILKLNKLENQQIFPSVEPYDLGEQLCQSLLQFENAWEQKQIEIDTDIEEGVTVCADAELLALVWNNLFSNAFKFTEPGGKVTVSLTVDGNYAIVKVTDTGCGMTPEVGKHIFEKFYQGDVSHATQGNGLGLALVKRIMDITRGEIAVQSVLGEGSIFTVRVEKA